MKEFLSVIWIVNYSLMASDEGLWRKNYTLTTSDEEVSLRNLEFEL